MQYPPPSITHPCCCLPVPSLTPVPVWHGRTNKHPHSLKPQNVSMGDGDALYHNLVISMVGQLGLLQVIGEWQWSGQLVRTNSVLLYVIRGIGSWFWNGLWALYRLQYPSKKDIVFIYTTEGSISSMKYNILMFRVYCALYHSVEFGYRFLDWSVPCQGAIFKSYYTVKKVLVWIIPPLRSCCYYRAVSSSHQGTKQLWYICWWFPLQQTFSIFLLPRFKKISTGKTRLYSVAFFYHVVWYVM